MISDVLADLKGDLALTALINGRVYRGMIPPSPTYPLIMFEANAEVQNLLSGQSSLQKVMFDFSILADSYVEAKLILNAMNNALYNASTYKTTVIAVDDGKFNDEIEQYQLTAQASVWG